MERLGQFDTYVEKAWPDGYNLFDSDFDELDNKICEDWNNLREAVSAKGTLGNATQPILTMESAAGCCTAALLL